MSVPITNCHILVQLAAVAGGIKASVKVQAASRAICTHAPRPNLNLRFNNVSESHFRAVSAEILGSCVCSPSGNTPFLSLVKSLHHCRLVADKHSNIFSLNFAKIFIIIFEKVVCFGK